VVAAAGEGERESAEAYTIIKWRGLFLGKNPLPSRWNCETAAELMLQLLVNELAA
jgi:hypothetical protein